MADEKKKELTPEELAQQNAEEMPDREEMSLVNANADETSAEAPSAGRRDDGGLDAAADDDEEEELSAPGSSATGLVAAPPDEQ